MSLRNEEVITTSPILISKLRDKLIKYFDILAVTALSKSEPKLGIGLKVGKIKDEASWLPKDVVVVDGGSSVISLNMGYIGICAAIAIHISKDRVINRYIAEPLIIPSDPKDITMYETLDQITGVIDKVREALVFELASDVAKHTKPDLLIIDGPLIPYSALAKKVVSSRDEFEALRRYRDAVLRLLKVSSGEGINVVGFVKRPRSMFLYRLGISDEATYDHVYLSRIMGPGEFFPNPPSHLPASEALFHEREILELVSKINPRFTFLRFTYQTPPYRVDLGYLSEDYYNVLSYLYLVRTREGIPYPVMKADEETKLSRKLMRELYEDVLHHYISKLALSGVKPDIIPVLPEYGW